MLKHEDPIQGGPGQVTVKMTSVSTNIKSKRRKNIIHNGKSNHGLNTTRTKKRHAITSLNMVINCPVLMGQECQVSMKPRIWHRYNIMLSYQ